MEVSKAKRVNEFEGKIEKKIKSEWDLQRTHSVEIAGSNAWKVEAVGWGEEEQHSD